MTKALEKQKVPDQEDGARELNAIFSDLLPWTIASTDTDTLRENVMRGRGDIERFLDSLYLFRVGEISVSADAQDVADLIYKRQQAAIVAAAQAGYTLTTIISGDGGGTVDIFLGVRGEEDVKDVFREQLQGVYPGKGIESDRERIVNRLKEQKHGGVLTGIPTQKIDKKKQTFDLSSVIRSMNGQEFLLAIVSRPVAKYETAQQLHELMNRKDQCHALANRQIGLEESAGINQSHAVQETEGESRSHGFNVGMTGLMGLMGLMLLPSVGYSYNKTKFSSRSETDSVGWSENVGRSLSYEQQNTLARELESIADKLITRLRNGLNTGLWESFITYATGSRTASQILSGTLAGELIKADPDALPIRNVSGALSADIPIFVPKERDGGSLITGNKLLSFLSSDEAALLMAPPLSSVPGYDIRVKPALSLTDTRDRAGYSIGRISEHGRVVKGSDFTISKDDIRKHIFVSGLTGSGKTTTVKHILHSIDTPFLVIESAKREYRRLLTDAKYDGNLRVYTVGDSGVSPIRHNPFMVLPGVSLITHIDNLKSIFYASFSLYGPMPYILEKCIYNIYKDRGWNLTTGNHQRVKIKTFADCQTHRFIYPTIRDLIDDVNRYVKEELEYKGELQDNIRSAIVARLESLAVGAKGFLFNTHDFRNIEDLLKGRVVFELESLSDDDDKAFFVGLMLALVSEYRQCSARESTLTHTDDLHHVLVIEEAHRLLKNVQTERTSEMIGNPKGKAVESFCNLIAEMRSYGQGVIVAEQIPTKIAPDVIKNTNTKIIHRLVSIDDQIAVGTGLGLEEQECRYLNQLSAGTALAHKEGMSKPVEISVFNELPNEAIGDIRIKVEGQEPELALHESGLLDSRDLRAIALRLLHSLFLSNAELDDLLPEAIKLLRSLFLSNSELDDLLPEAIKTARKAEQLMYVTDETIERALREWFCRVLFFLTLGLAKERVIDGDVLEAVNRLWDDRLRFNRVRFMAAFDKWLGESSRDRIMESVANLAIYERGTKKSKKTDIKLPEALDKIVDKKLLVDDREIVQEIRNAIRKRIVQEIRNAIRKRVM